MSEYTAGPWTVSFGGAGTAYIYANDHPGDRLAGVISRPSKEHSIVERDANARLIGASPEMLDALKEAVHAVEAFNNMVEVMRKFETLPIPSFLDTAAHNCPIVLARIRDAISKAEPRSTLAA